MILHSDTVVDGDQPPAKWLYMLHGIFGSGRNWASMARRLVRQRPDWGVRLIDLRQHGSSQGFAAPHTVAAAAADLAQLADHHGETVSAVLGHSFGGKVALAYARTHSTGLQQVWVIDSTPEAKPPGGSAWSMLQLVRAAPLQYSSRDALIEYLTENGTALPVAQWMATNLEHRGSAYEWRFDLDAIEALLDDFFVQDLWDAIESPAAEIHIVKAEESSVLSSSAIERIQGAAANGQVFYHEVAGGHWVNAENPNALHELLTRHLA